MTTEVPEQERREQQRRDFLAGAGLGAATLSLIHI